MTTTLEQATEHGLSEAEFEKIVDILGRTPNVTELGVFSVMWSEHCSYKSSRIHLATLPTEGPQVVQGPGENAGAVDIGDGWAAVFKMESHNHPSYIEPFQGAATGVGGIMRDVFTMGARPIANLNSLRFGGVDHPRTNYLVGGVVGGIAHYGNCMGVPTVGGEVYFDESYNGNILVNAFTLGVVKSSDIFKGVAEGVGNPVFYVGSGTGRDGIHGATMASDTFEEGDEEKRPTVQVGDPFREKLLLEACLELMATGAIIGIQDMGAAGLTSSSVEMADRAETGLILDIDKVPMREEGMTAYEALLSESQERMLMVVDPARQDEVGRIFDKWELEWAQIGEVTDTQRLEVFRHGERVCDLPIDALASQAPKYDRPASKPKYIDELADVRAKDLAPLDDLSAYLTWFVGTPNLCSRRAIYQQYDHMVGAATVLRPGDSDAAAMRTPANGIAVAVDCNSRKCFIDPREGAKHAVAECARNIACVGAKAIGTTDCLNFGDPTNPEIMWQFKEAIAGLGEACRALDVPIVGGNVSLYNASDGVDIFPTPTVACVGVFDRPLTSRDQVVPTRVWSEENVIFSLGAPTDPGDLGGSEFLWLYGKAFGASLPPLDLELERRTQYAVRELIAEGLIDSAHDCSDGGLAVALLEKLFGTGLGFEFDLELPDRPDLYLLCETPSRILVSCDIARRSRIKEVAKKHDITAIELGRVTDEGQLLWGDALCVDIASAETSWRDGLSNIV